MLHLVCMKHKIIKQSMHLSKQPGLIDNTTDSPFPPDDHFRHSFFKSKTRRKLFLPVSFRYLINKKLNTFLKLCRTLQKLGPAPGDYEPQTSVINANPPIVTSSFRSGTDRFFKKPTNVPGPGSYDKLTVFPTPKQIDSFSSRGVFFSANFARMNSTAV